MNEWQITHLKFVIPDGEGGQKDQEDDGEQHFIFFFFWKTRCFRGKETWRTKESSSLFI